MGRGGVEIVPAAVGAFGICCASVCAPAIGTRIFSSINPTASPLCRFRVFTFSNPLLSLTRISHLQISSPAEAQAIPKTGRGPKPGLKPSLLLRQTNAFHKTTGDLPRFQIFLDRGRRMEK
jgi:hypothetical protein